MARSTFKLVSTDRAAICKGCGVNIVWRVGATRPLLLADGSEHVCAKYVRKAFASTGRRRFTPSAPDTSIPAGRIVKRGGKPKACPTCGFDHLEWLQVQQANGYAKWFLAPFGTEDLSGSLHATRPETCQLGDAAPTKHDIGGNAPSSVDEPSIAHGTRRTARKAATPAPTTALLITLDNGAIITISNVAKFDVVAN